MLSYDDAGPVPLLLVHGHPFDRSMWRPQIARFRSERRVLVPDLRGYGETGGAATAWTQLADDLVTVLDGARVPRAVVVGLSMGGQVALELHRIAPSRVAGLLLANTTSAAEHDRRGRLASADRLEREGMDPYAVDNLYRMVAPGSPAAPHVLAMMRAADPHGAAAAQRARADRPAYPLADVAVPAAVVVGALDHLTTPEVARAMAATLPDAELTVVEDAAHLPNLERPDAFDTALERLLDRVPAPPVW